jgi:hypothetical protein
MTDLPRSQPRNLSEGLAHLLRSLGTIIGISNKRESVSVISQGSSRDIALRLYVGGRERGIQGMIDGLTRVVRRFISRHFLFLWCQKRYIR